jgi:hypothetical protein
MLVRSLVFLVAALAAVPAIASEEDATTVSDFCRTELNTPPKVCDCVMGRFAGLSEGQQALLGAILREDTAELPALLNALSAEEAGQAESFLTHEILLCKPSG